MTEKKQFQILVNRVLLLMIWFLFWSEIKILLNQTGNEINLADII